MITYGKMTWLTRQTIFWRHLEGFFGGQNRFNKLESDLLKQWSIPLLMLDYWSTIIFEVCWNWIFLDLCLVIQGKGKGFHKSDFLDKSLKYLSNKKFTSLTTPSISSIMHSSTKFTFSSNGGLRLTLSVWICVRWSILTLKVSFY